MWFKGCLHLHTTNSDGKLKPTEVYNCYKDKGYDFISITDHDFITKLDLGLEKNFLVIENSVEFSCGFEASDVFADSFAASGSDSFGWEGCDRSDGLVGVTGECVVERFFFVGCSA